MNAAWTPAAGIDLPALSGAGPVHFMGIAGAGMSALAELLLRSGGTVTGCDTHPGIAGEALRAHGARVVRGHDPAHVTDAVAVVATSAVPADHPELEAARARGIPVLKRAQALGAIVNAGTVVAIAGTHGKTTTTAMTTAILSEASLDPTAFVGGRVPGWGGGLRAGGGHLFVVEADEYDRSFLALHPRVAVITSVDADHLDIYGSLDRVEDAFTDFIAAVPPDPGLVAACVDDAGAARLAARAACPVLGYGTGATARLRAVDVRFDGRASRFTVIEDGKELGELALRAPGVHNVRNALGAFAAARHVGANFDDAARGLAAFKGVGRRFQEIGNARDVVFVDDYAHHPTEIDATLAAARAAYGGRRIVAVFQPHLFSRTRDFAAGFGRALAAADVVWVTDVYAAREAPVPGVTGALVADAARAAGAAGVHYVPDLERLAHEVAGAVRAGDVCLAMGAGNIDVALRDVLARVRAAERAS